MREMKTLLGRNALLQVRLKEALEREAGLAALVERMREYICDVVQCAVSGTRPSLVSAGELLSLTPPAAFEALRRREREAAMREAANLIRQTTPDATDDEFSKGKYDGRIYAIEQIESMANAIAAERSGEGGAA